MHHRSSSGLTRWEVVVALTVIGAFAVVLLGPHPLQEHEGNRGRQHQTLIKMRQLYLSTQQMALDGELMKDTNIGWPGDIGGSFSNWTAQLLKGNYLSRNDLCELLSAHGMTVSTNNPLTRNTTAVLVYAASTNSPDTAIFLTTANFTNTPAGGILNPKVRPYGNKAFIVFCKSGEGTIHHPRRVGLTNLIGSYVPLCR